MHYKSKVSDRYDIGLKESLPHPFMIFLGNCRGMQALIFNVPNVTIKKRKENYFLSIVKDFGSPIFYLKGRGF